MVDSSWDIDRYKTKHESEEHWELRKKFILTHKETLPEDELVCMAQVFTNIEFLGCRYPDETMIRVAELAKGVVEEFREKKKDTLKRTFVAASDAASSKVKGLGNLSIKKCGKEVAQSKRAKPLIFCSPSSLSHSLQTAKNDVLCSPPKMLNVSNPLAKVVVFITPNASYVEMLQRTIASNRLLDGSKYESNVMDDGSLESTFFLKSNEFSKGLGKDKKSARESAAFNALKKLRQQCYTILIKKKISGQAVNQTDIGENTSNQPEQTLGEDNLGSKLMRLMGWTGGGLGSAAQGRVDPIPVTTTVRRAGLGMNDAGCPIPFRKAIRRYLTQWLNKGATHDLLFSTDFDKEHRKIVHQVSSSMGLKSQSYGAEGNRRLVVSKKLSPWDLVTDLAQGFGDTDKYELIDPGVPLPDEK